MRKLKRKLQSVSRRTQRLFSDARRSIRRTLQARVLRHSIDGAQLVLAGNFLRLGGIRSHLQGIKTHSSLKAKLFPSEFLRSIVQPSELMEVAKWVVEQKLRIAPRIWHSHVFPVAIDAGLRMRERGAAWVHTYHLPYFPEHSIGEMPEWQKTMNQAQLEVGSAADIKVSVSRWQRDYLERAYGINCVYIPNGIDCKMIQRADAARFREKHKVMNNFVLYVGRDDPVKNPVEFVRLAKSMPNRLFLAIGRNLNPEYIKRIWGEESPDNIRYLPEQPRSDVLDAIKASDCLVVTSLREGLPTLVLEAMVSCTPVVAGDEPGSAEALDGGRYGSLYPLGNISELHEAVRKVLFSKSSTGAARDWANREYDWAKAAAMLDHTYSLLGKRNA